MRILFLGVYRDGTGYGEAATRHVLALDAAGADVVCRPVKLNDASHRPPDRVLELEARPARGIDAVVQCVLPHQMDYDGRLGLNAGMYFSETDTIGNSVWNDRLDMMDLAIGCSAQMEEAARRAKMTVPYAVVPVPCEPSAYTSALRAGPLEDVLPPGPDFRFYTVGEMVRRKNLAALLRAFHAEFSPDEPVQLVIKTSRPGMPAHETRRHVEAFCRQITDGLKFYGGDGSHFRREVVLTERMSHEEVLRLHASCDCFVQVSRGEAWSIPAFDAMAMGKTPIVTDWGGYREYVTGETGWPVEARPEPVYGEDGGFADLYTARDSWAAVDILALRRAMREAYEDRDLRQRKAAAGIERASGFSYQKVGARLREVLEHHERRKREQHGLEGPAGQVP